MAIKLFRWRVRVGWGAFWVYGQVHYLAEYEVRDPDDSRLSKSCPVRAIDEYARVDNRYELLVTSKIIDLKLIHKYFSAKSRSFSMKTLLVLKMVWFR